jgi:hypothetical protein
VLIVKGTRTRLHMKDGGPMIRPAGAMMHDESGRYWPKNSILIGPFSRGSERPTEAQYRGAPKEYLGRTYDPHIGEVDLPPKALSSWEDVGEVSRIDYVRPGRKAPGGFRHSFNAPRGAYRLLHAVKGKGRAMLRKCGRFYRLDMSKGSIADSRGIVWP